MKKYQRDNKIAVIFSPGYGSGWYSWHKNEELLFDHALVTLILQLYEGQRDEVTNEIIKLKIDTYLSKKYPDITMRGPFAIAWIEKDEEFYIHEYDGFETIRLKKNMQWIKA